MSSTEDVIERNEEYFSLGRKITKMKSINYSAIEYLLGK